VSRQPATATQGKLLGSRQHEKQTSSKVHSRGHPPAVNT